MSIRRLKSTEAGFLKEMLFEALFVPPGEKPFEKEILESDELKRIYADWGKTGDVAYVMEINERLVGAAWSRVYKKEWPGYGYVNDQTPELSVALLEPYRNRGYGTTLIMKLIKDLRWKGFPGVSLSVDRRNRAFELYRKLGFSVVSDGPNPVMLLEF